MGGGGGGGGVKHMWKLFVSFKDIGEVGCKRPKLQPYMDGGGSRCLYACLARNGICTKTAWPHGVHVAYMRNSCTAPIA